MPQANYYDNYAFAGSMPAMAYVADSATGSARGRVSHQTYSGDRIFSGDSLTYSYFPGGYFDGKGGVYYTHVDYLGSITMVTDATGNLVQHTGYYPYGEPWREPSGQPRLYGGKERERFMALNDYDFHARRLNSATTLWNAPDPLAGNYTNLSPYVYCAANPIMYADPTGMKFTEETKEKYIEPFKSETLRLAFSDESKKETYLSIYGNILALEASDQLYSIKVGDEQGIGKTEYDIDTETVVMTICENAGSDLLAHELFHSYQFEKGLIDISEKGKEMSKKPYMFDKYDELDAYNVGEMFGGDHWTIEDVKKEKDYKDLHDFPLDYHVLDVPFCTDIKQREAGLSQRSKLRKRIFRIGNKTYTPYDDYLNK